MTRDEARQVLGKPRQELKYRDGTSVMLYPHGFHDPIVIDLDEKGQVAEEPWEMRAP